MYVTCHFANILQSWFEGIKKQSQAKDKIKQELPVNTDRPIWSRRRIWCRGTPPWCTGGWRGRRSSRRPSHTGSTCRGRAASGSPAAHPLRRGDSCCGVPRLPPLPVASYLCLGCCQSRFVAWCGTGRGCMCPSVSVREAEKESWGDAVLMDSGMLDRRDGGS